MSRSENRSEPAANDDDGSHAARQQREIEALKAQAAERARRALAQQDADRMRIARDLHDTLGQYFTVLAIELEALRHPALPREDITAGIDRIARLSEEARRETDQLAWEIRPPQLGETGIEEAVPALLAEWGARTGIVFQSHIAMAGRRFSSAIESTLFRVLQEAIRNVVKHAGASRAGVVLQASAKDISLTIEDDGVGFALREDGAPLPEDSSGQGLLGAQERLALVGGSLEVETALGGGTTLLIHVPL
jgi:signal transduction histidine kinase